MAMRRRRSTSCSFGKLIWNGLIASRVVAACACLRIRLEAATAAEAPRTLRRSGDGDFTDMITSTCEARSWVVPKKGLISMLLPHLRAGQLVKGVPGAKPSNLHCTTPSPSRILIRAKSSHRPCFLVRLHHQRLPGAICEARPFQSSPLCARGNVDLVGITGHRRLKIRQADNNCGSIR
jgi:hypothetical protein